MISVNLAATSQTYPSVKGFMSYAKKRRKKHIKKQITTKSSFVDGETDEMTIYSQSDREKAFTIKPTS